MTLADKVEIYRLTVAALSKGVKLAAICAREGREGELVEVERKNAQLAKVAADLRRNISRDWRLRAGEIIEGIRKQSGLLQRRIKEIEQTTATSEKVAKALGVLDELIDLARKVVEAAA